MNQQNHHQNHQTEYSRQYQWQQPMIETKPIVKNEPIMSQYQSSYGHYNNHNQPNSLIINNNNHYGDENTTDVLDNSNNLNNKQPISLPICNYIVPGMAIRNMAIVEPEIKTNYNENNDLILTSSPSPQPSSISSSSTQQQHSSLKSSQALFDYEKEQQPQSSPILNEKISEYHSKFKDFNEYVYVEGDGFKKSDLLPLKAKQMAQSWFSEVNERSKQACKYRARSRNGATPVNPEYSWNGVPVKDRNDLAALALATKLNIEQKRSERSSNQSSRSASAKPHLRSSNYNNNLKMNSAPPSLQDDRIVSKTKPLVSRKPPVTGAETNVDRNNNNNNSKVITKKILSVKKPQQQQQTTNDGSAKQKIWIKPTKKTTPTTNETKTNQQSVDNNNQQQQREPEREFDPIPKQVPLHTTQIKSPEQLSGIKSPSPESWKVTIEKGGLNWISNGDGGGVNVDNNNNNKDESTNLPVNFPIDTQSLIQHQQQQNEQQMVRPVPINGMSSV